MNERLSALRFWALWIIAIIAVAGYASGNIPWDKLL